VGTEPIKKKKNKKKKKKDDSEEEEKAKVNVPNKPKREEPVNLPEAFDKKKFEEHRKQYKLPFSVHSGRKSTKQSLRKGQRNGLSFCQRFEI
jgi:hypothetical protein